MANSAFSWTTEWREVEYISETSFRFARAAPLPLPVLEDRSRSGRAPIRGHQNHAELRGRHLSIEIRKGHPRYSASPPMTKPSRMLPSSRRPTAWRCILPRPAGLRPGGPGDAQRFFFATGYGIFIRTPRQLTFNLPQGVVNAPAARSMEAVFTTDRPQRKFRTASGGHRQDRSYGTNLCTFARRTSCRRRHRRCQRRDRDLGGAGATGAPRSTSGSLSGVLYPGAGCRLVQLFARRNPRGARADLAEMLPLLYGDKKHPAFRPARTVGRLIWSRICAKAYDRGYPLIRPFPVEFSRDKTSSRNRASSCWAMRCCLLRWSRRGLAVN